MAKLPKQQQHEPGNKCLRILGTLGAIVISAVSAAYVMPWSRWTTNVNWSNASMTSDPAPPRPLRGGGGGNSVRKPAGDDGPDSPPPVAAAAAPPATSAAPTQPPPSTTRAVPTRPQRTIPPAPPDSKYPFRTSYPSELTQEELGITQREHRTIQLNGDPKSGTTLTETIAWLAAAMFCKHDGSTLGDAEAEAVGLGGSGGCHWITKFNTKRTTQFGLKFPSRNAEVYFTIDNKHTILGTHGTTMCERGDSPLQPWHDPCNNGTFSLEAVQNCQLKCVNPEYTGGDIGVTGGVLLLIWRDIRNIVISACFAKDNGNFIKTDENFYKNNLVTCVKRIYAQFATWARYRLLWFSNMPFKRRIVNVCYEGLIRKPTKEYRKILGALGLNATEAQLADLIEQASPKKLKKSENQEIAMKVRDAGKKSYRDYGLSKEIIDWMDSAYTNLSFDLGWNPCWQEQAEAAAAGGYPPATPLGVAATATASGAGPAPPAEVAAGLAAAQAASPGEPVPGTVAYQLWPRKALPGPLDSKESRFVQLNGDPKSGTTLTEMIAVLAADYLCNEGTRDEAAKTSGGALCTGNIDREEGKEFNFQVPDRQAKVHFSIGNKHTILGTHGGIECQRGEPPLDPPGNPCGYNYRKNYSLALLKKCLKHCVDPEYHRGDFEVKQGVLLLVWRDVRNQVISTCFSEDTGNFNPRFAKFMEQNLESCVRRLFPRIALWSRYRQLWFSSLYFPRQITNICYEKLIKEPLKEFRKVFASLGLPASDEQVLSIVEKTKPAKLKHSANVDMAKKVRDAGARDYRGYGLPQGTIDWMDDLYKKLSFEEDSPCH